MAGDKQSLRALLRAHRRRTRIAQSKFPTYNCPPEVTRILSEQPTITSYVSFPGEPPLDALHPKMRAMGAQVFLPVALTGGQLRWVKSHGQPEYAWGVTRDIPEEPLFSTSNLGHLSLVFVPALAVTREGQRLGQGGGYYDRLLSELPSFDQGGPLRAAVVWDDEILPSLPTDRWDETVDVVITFQ